MTELSRRGLLLSAGSLAIASASGLLLSRPLRAAMGPNDKFDLLVKGGEVLDPSQNLRAKRDVAMEFVDTRNNKRAGKIHLKPAHAGAAGVAFGRPYQAPFTVR